MRLLFARAERALSAGAPVILDGTFLDERWREEAARVARARGAPFVLIETSCDEDVVARRLAAREASSGSLSDATRDTYRHQRAAIAAAPPAIPRGVVGVQIDTTPETTLNLEPVFAALHREGIIAATIPSTAWWGTGPYAVVGTSPIGRRILQPIVLRPRARQGHCRHRLRYGMAAAGLRSVGVDSPPCWDLASSRAHPMTTHPG